MILLPDVGKISYLFKIRRASKIIFEAKRPLFAIFADINNITKVMITIMATVRNMDF